MDYPCKVCGWSFYGFAHLGELCSAECDALDKTKGKVTT